MYPNKEIIDKIKEKLDFLKDISTRVKALSTENSIVWIKESAKFQAYDEIMAFIESLKE